MEDDQAIDLDKVNQSELPISSTDLDSHSSMVALGRNFQMNSDTSRTAKVSPFTTTHESMCQVYTVDDAIRYYYECTRERDTCL